MKTVCGVCGREFEVKPYCFTGRNTCSWECKYESQRMTPARFWSKISVGDGGNCWEWQGARDKNGYGFTEIRGVSIKAHRYAWILSNGREIPKDMCICHRCDNPPCCNPAHLWVGTNAENTKDRCAKGRSNTASGKNHGLVKHPECVARGKNHGLVKHPERAARGEASGSSKLTEPEILAIRKEHAGGKIFQWQIAKKYGVSQTCICAIIARRTWKHI